MEYVEDHLLKKFPEAGSVRSDAEKQEAIQNLSWSAFARAELCEHFEILLTPEELVPEIVDFYLSRGHIQDTSNQPQIKFVKDGIIRIIEIAELGHLTIISVVAIDL